MTALRWYIAGLIFLATLIISMQSFVGWRATFVVLGLAGFVWLAAWLHFYAPPELHPRITPEEYALLGPQRSVTGMGGLAAATGAILLNHTTGIVTDRFHSYAPILVTAALLPLLATVALFALGGPIRRITFEHTERLHA